MGEKFDHLRIYRPNGGPPAGGSLACRPKRSTTEWAGGACSRDRPVDTYGAGDSLC